jgi:hypothetical protein
MRATALLVGSALLVVACGGAAKPSASAPPVAAPTATPDLHLKDPASVDPIFRALSLGGLRIVANTASEGPGGEPSEIINATYAGWPLLLSQYSSHSSLIAHTKFDPNDHNRAGDPPFSIVGLNILIQFGPTTGRTGVTPPDASYIAAAQKLVAVIDPLLGPLAQRSVVPLNLPVASVPPSPSLLPSASPSTKPSTKPKVTPRPKATPKPSG